MNRDTPAKRLAEMALSNRHEATAIEGFGVRMYVSAPPKPRRITWTCDGQRIAFTALLELLERHYRANHPESIKLPPLPVGNLYTDSCPQSKAWDHEQMYEYARAAVELNK